MPEIKKTKITTSDHERISQCIEHVLEHYFKDMENHFNGDLYDLVTTEVERPLVQKVMDFTNYNQSNAASILGISRGTLRKKIKQYHINSKK